jgi:hypothetical protein
MLSKDQIYQVWAPQQAIWSRWVKPVLFAFADGILKEHPDRAPSFNPQHIPAAGTTAIIVELPGQEGVLWGIQLARLGYRPVALYNALPFPPQEKMTAPASRTESTVNGEPILAALVHETAALGQIQLLSGAPPAFLLDADRRIAMKDPAPGRFDNRSVCFSTDFPSAEFLLAQGIRQVVIVQKGSDVAGDLLQPLLAWQKSGIRLLRMEPAGTRSPFAMVAHEPTFLRRLSYRLGVAFGLRRSELGGFGGIVPSGGG